MAPVPKPARKKDDSLLAAVRGFRCAACGKEPPSDPAHVRSRGAGGPDEPWNLLPLCRNHHQEQHKRGWVTFSFRFPSVAFDLIDKGWHVTISGLRRSP